MAVVCILNIDVYMWCASYHFVQIITYNYTCLCMPVSTIEISHSNISVGIIQICPSNNSDDVCIIKFGKSDNYKSILVVEFGPSDNHDDTGTDVETPIISAMTRILSKILQKSCLLVTRKT